MQYEMKVTWPDGGKPIGDILYTEADTAKQAIEKADGYLSNNGFAGYWVHTVIPINKHEKKVFIP